MPAGASPKREREFKELRANFKQSGRYQGREEEVAARIVNKQRANYGETKEERQKDRKGISPDRNLPIDDFQSMTIAELKPKLDALAPSQLKKVRQYEARHKNRKGLLQILDRRIRNA